MSHRKLLTLTVLFLGVFAGVLSLVPFVVSLSPRDVVEVAHELRVSLDSVPGSGFAVFEWRDYKIFVSKQPELRVFRIPFHQGDFRLPDLAWNRAYIPCREFVVQEGVFQCLDRSMPEWWRTNARWDASGVSQNQMFPALESPPFAVSGNEITIGCASHR